MERLPYVDEHRTQVGVPPERAWAAVREVATPFVTASAPRLFAAAWRLDPASGFAIAEEAPPRHLVLRGRHRFSRYELAFDVEATPEGAVVHARTSAAFPGLHGRAYRALVIGSGGHRIAVRRILRRIATQAERRT